MQKCHLQQTHDAICVGDCRWCAWLATDLIGKEIEGQYGFLDTIFLHHGHGLKLLQESLHHR